MISSSTGLSPALPRTAKWPASLAAIALGALLVYLGGFAQAHVVHDATHDARHGTALPCH